MATQIFQSIKFFNETRNGLDFSLNTSDFTTSLKGNVGEKVKMVAEIDYENVIEHDKDGTLIQVQTDGSGDFLRIANSNWEDLGFRVGDAVQIQDFKTGGPSGSTKAEGTITSSVDGAKIYVTITGAWAPGTYDQFEIRQVTEFKKFEFTFNTQSDVGGSRTQYTPFNLPQVYSNDDTTLVGDGGPRSTAFVTFAPRQPESWNTGLFKMRYVSNPTTFTQRFEIEHEFIITPYHLQTNTYSPLTVPSEFDNGTLSHEWNIKEVPPSLNLRDLINYDLTSSVGWFNENFDGGATNYALDSISFYDLTDGATVSAINFDNVTRVTAVLSGDLFTAGEGVVAYHSKAPSEIEYQDVNNTYNENWINESLRNTIGAVSNSGTIIQNLSINLDDAQHITVTYDLDFTSEDVVVGDSYLLWFGVEDSNLSSEDSNRVMLFGDYNAYIKSNDEADLFEITKFEIYNHLQDVDVDTPTTDLEGYIEDGILLDIEFKWKKDDDGNDRQDLADFRVGLCAYNTVDEIYFYITNQYFFTSSDGGLDGTFKHPEDWLNSIRFQDFLLANDDQFNKAHTGSPTLSTDIQYLSNDGTDGSYRALIGVKVDWQQIRRLDENVSTKRVYDSISDDFNGVNYRVSDVLKDGIFNDASQLNNGINKKLSNYWNKGNWIIRPVITSVVDNINTNDETTFIHFMPEWNVFNYDSNSSYTANVETFDSDDNDLTGQLLAGEDNKVVIEWDDTTTKTDVANFEGVIRIEVLNQSGWNIHELSTFRDTYSGNILQGFGTGGVNVEKTINGSDNYVMTCLVDGTLLDATQYKISARIYDKEVTYNPADDENLLAWYDVSGLLNNTDNAYGTVSASDEVSNWKNLKGDSTYDLINASVPNQPIYISLGLNSAITTDGFTEYLYWLDKDLGSQFSIFAVVDVINVFGTNMFAFIDGDSAINNKNELLMYTDNGASPELFMESWNDSGAITSIEQAGSVGKAVLQYSFNEGGNWYLKINDVKYTAPDSVQNAPLIDANNNAFFLGAFGLKNAGTPIINYFSQGEYQEVLIYPNIDVSTYESLIHDYLKNKWGI